MPSTENNYQDTDLGNITFNPRGEYDSEASYEYLDTVSYQGGTYMCCVKYPNTITGIEPEKGKNSEYWQIVAAPGRITSEYIAMHDDVVNKAKQVETSRAAVELSQQEVEAAQADVSQMRQDTQDASQAAIASRDSAAGYAQSAEASRTAAKESEDNINAQVTGFDTHVAEKTSAAELAVEKARKTAIDAITTQQDNSTKAVADEGTEQIKSVNDAGTKKVSEVNSAGETQVKDIAVAGQTAIDAIETQQSESEKAVSDKATEQISAINTAGDTQVTSINTAGSEQVTAVENVGTAQIGAVEEEGNQQNVNITEAAAQELIKLQEVAAQFAGDHEQIETNKNDIESLRAQDVTLEEKINKKIQVWFPGKTVENSTLTTKSSVLSGPTGDTILDLAGNEIGITVEVVAPAPPYYLGNLWVSDDAIYICTTAQETGDFRLFDWMKILERK